MGDIAKNWKQLSGENEWEGLLDPLNINLRKCIIHYGERVQAVYDSFNHDKSSALYGFPLYAPKDLFSNVGLEKGNPFKYTVTNYLYAMTDIDSSIDWIVKDQSSWIGYIAVVTDEGKVALGRRDILISWRGTLLTGEWLKDVNWPLTSASNLLGETHHNPKPHVHQGFHSLYTSSNPKSQYNKFSAREQVLSALSKLVDKYKDEEISITITGHSLGSALATLNAVDIVSGGFNKPTGSDQACMVTVFVFASPKVGDKGFKTAFNKLSNLHLLHIRNINDIVPKLPFIFYFKVGKQFKFDTTKSTYVKADTAKQIGALHKLENYLHGIAGTMSEESGKFELIVKRDIALLNKGADLLKSEFGVPPEWWDPMMNKRMVQQNDGSWKLEYYVPECPSA
ncbi:phospholipase A1-IIgamma-like [Mangifera indica]|uniref:phospholipase A1-IIgamma-like n=1 Tax=Mangifera indica TaxID=29780 RepID=UPI001CF96AD6|nr:phospholipase A1-IIgamma-like [Mangifera indica]